MQDSREIIVSPMAFHAPKVVNVAHGSTIRDIVHQLYPDTYVMVEIDGVPIPRDQWHMTPPVDSHVLISVPLHGGGGGKNPLRTLLTIAVIVAATVVSGGALGPVLGPAFGAGTMGASIAGAVTLTAGMMLTNAIAPIRFGSTGPTTRQTYKDSPTYSIGANQNQENKWGSVPVMLGRHKVYPPLGASSYTELVGSDEYLRMLLVWGYGPLDVSDIKIGDTLLSSYSDVEIETNEGWSTDTPLTLFPSSVSQTAISVKLMYAAGQITQTAEANVDELSCEVSFPRGLVRYGADGNRHEKVVRVIVQYREVGGGAWTTVENKVFTDITTSAIRYGWRWTVDNTKQYEIAMTRVTVDSTDDKIIDEVYWTYLRSIKTTYPISFPHNLAVTALRIKATDQLSGQLNNINGVISSYCPVWDDVAEEWGSDEADYEITNNPAALIRWVLTCAANARARTATQIDDDTLGEFYEFCETNGYAFNMYRDYTASVFETCQDIAAAARGAVTIKDGLWSVVADTGEQTLVQHITPRNSWGFSAEKRLYNRPHAFRVRFRNEDNDYNDDERIVYDDGYNSSNATLFESIEFPGITNPALIWKFGRFHIAQARLRPEMYSLYQDFEHLVCRRGDKVRVSHDIPLWGSGWGRVKSLVTDGGNITHVVLDELVTMEAGKSYACRFRLANGDTLVLSVETAVGTTEPPTITQTTDTDAEWDAGTHDGTIADSDALELQPVQGSGTWTSAGLSLSSLITARSSLIEWSATEPEGTSVTIEAAVSTDGVTAPESGWSACTSGESIPGITAGDRLVGQYLWLRATLTSDDYATTPSVTSLSVTVDSDVGGALELKTPVAEALGPEVGDLAMFGEADSETVELLVHSIQRAGDYTAQLFLVDVASDIYDADTGTIPAFDPQTTAPVNERELTPATPIIAGVEAGTAALEVSGSAVISRILVYLSPPTGTLRIRGYRARFRLQGETPWRYTQETDSLTVPVSPVQDLNNYEVQAQAISIYDVHSKWSATETVYVTGQTDAPSDVTGFSVNILDGEAHLSWTAVTDIDLSHYRIRWSPALVGASWLESVDVVRKVGKPATSVSVPAMMGTYLIKAVDFAGFESENATSQNTTISSVRNLNFVEALDQSNPDWDGASRGVAYSSGLGGLALEIIDPNPTWDTDIAWATDIEWSSDDAAGQIMDEGYFVFADTIDLSAVFQSRVTASITATAADIQDDLYDIDDLYDMADLYSVIDGNLYSVQLEMRYTSDDPSGTPTWTSWRPFLVGDYSARAYQFRVALSGTPPNITPVVTAVYVSVDMPDRVIGFSGTIAAGGSTISFDPAFYATPEIGISVSDGQEGDKYTITGLDETGFTIAFTNGGSNVERNISGIAKAYGEQEVA